ncbi:MAG: glycogen debranching protein GlgX [Gemmataceae bacterium]
MSVLPTTVARGRALPLGASATTNGVNFAILCRHGTAVSLVIFPLDSDHPLSEIALDPHVNRTGDHWHVLVAPLPPSFRYAWRVDGPAGAKHRYNPEILLLDPACTAVSDGTRWGQNGHYFRGPWSGTRGTHRRSLFIRQPFDWREDAPLKTPLEDSIIYELHVRGFTAHPSSGVSKPGTFAGLIEKIPHLKELGVTAVELLPVHEFDEDDCVFSNPETGESLRNFWGYNSIAFAAPKAAFASKGPEGGQVTEFREMVRAFHEAKIEVYLDVVFNHTGEGDDRGRTYSFRGLDNELYYMLGPNGEYMNFSGCGNTVNCNHPIVRDIILTCLRFWVGDMHVDGLRFDLASIFGRDRNGNVLMEPPIVEMIAEDGLLSHTKLIAEPWDAVGLYQVGGFPYGKRWSEWNGRYRDDVRNFGRGDIGMTADLATRLCGSADLYEWSGRRPSHSVNFITCHDGFTLNDLVSYNQKHNEANGEANRDGANDNNSWNCGIEGPTNDRVVQKLRHRQARNLFATLMLSQGTPMLLAGDEFLRTQQGNNNAWCQDNELSWIDWTLKEQNADFFRFARMMIALRKRHPALRRRDFFKGRGPSGDFEPDIIWHGVEPHSPDFSHGSRTLAYSINGSMTGREPDSDFYVACNAWSGMVHFRLPPSPSGRPWYRIVDTAVPAPLDIVSEADAKPMSPQYDYPVAAHSMVVLLA